MEGKKEVSPKSSSFTSDLFGSKESSGSSSAGIFGSIFAPSSKVVGKESIRFEVDEKKVDGPGQFENAEPGAHDTWSNEGKNQNSLSKDTGPFYQEEKVQPCHLSSSIYYGGQDIYSHPQKTQSSGYSTMNKDGGEDDGTASRGNWWQGSLYY